MGLLVHKGFAFLKPRAAYLKDFLQGPTLHNVPSVYFILPHEVEVLLCSVVGIFGTDYIFIQSPVAAYVAARNETQLVEMILMTKERFGETIKQTVTVTTALDCLETSILKTAVTEDDFSNFVTVCSTKEKVNEKTETKCAE